MKPSLPNFESLRIMAIGKAMMRQTMVLAKARPSDSPSACMWSWVNTAVTLSKVKPPSLVVNP